MKEIYLRNVILGIADSLVSTVGLLSGIDVSGTPHGTIILTGIVYAFVEAFSMAVGSFLSEQSAEEYAIRGEITGRKPFVAGLVMFISFVLASFIPIFPYVISSGTWALWSSIGLSLVTLFILGIVIAKISKVSMLKHATKMLLLGGAAIIIGVIVGKIIKSTI